MKVFAFAALVLVLVLALALVGCSSSDPDEAAAPQPVTVTETVTETETVPEPEVQCSSAGVHATLSDQELPQAVAEVRKRILDAAVACDYDALEQIALEQGEGFTFSYGADTDAAEYWRRVEEKSTEEPKPMRALVTILTMPYTRNESGSYAWPTAYNESPTEEAWRVLVVSGIYPQEQIDSMKAGGSYLGYRTAITPDGDWQFFVAGD
jgi:hypothetical protein